MEFSSKTSLVRNLPVEDMLKLKKLFNDSPDYFKLVAGRPPEEHDAEEIFTELPPHKALKDKSVLGIYQDSTFVGVLDLIRDYPKEKTWFIGLLLIDPTLRGKGLGKDVYESLKEHLKTLGARSIMISVAEKNVSAIAFWKALGFIERDSKTEVKGETEKVFIYFENIL